MLLISENIRLWEEPVFLQEYLCCNRLREDQPRQLLNHSEPRTYQVGNSYDPGDKADDLLTSQQHGD